MSSYATTKSVSYSANYRPHKRSAKPKFIYPQDYFNPLDFETALEDSSIKGAWFWEPKEPLYSVMLEQYADLDTAKKELHAISVRLDRWIKTKYPNISVMAGLSRVQGNGAKREPQKAGRGRPKTHITGKAVKPHIHMVVYGEGAASFCQKLQTKYNRKKGYTAMKHKRQDCMSFVSYVYNQSSSIRTGGAFNFAPYCIPYDKDAFPRRAEPYRRYKRNRSTFGTAFEPLKQPGKMDIKTANNKTSWHLNSAKRSIDLENDEYSALFTHYSLGKRHRKPRDF